MTDAFFRANVGACVVDAGGRILALKRKGVASGSWQMPQGGIEWSEEPRTALFRELREETSLDRTSLDLVAECPEWLVYELPHDYRNAKVGWGQAQRWFLLRIHPGAVPRPDGIEFDDVAWLEPPALLARVVSFRTALYVRVLTEFRRLGYLASDHELR